MKKEQFSWMLMTPALLAATACGQSEQPLARPNVVLIYCDDLGYGDLSCYGAEHISTPNLDALADSGIRFTDCHSGASTSTPARYALMTGRYAWRTPGTDVIPGDAALLIDTAEFTLPKVFKTAGYQTAAIGKWHLGLGNEYSTQDWNHHVAPGPAEIGFDYSYIIPATGDRVPCVFLENQEVVNLDPDDPISVSYKKPFPGEVVAKEHPELLKLMWSHGHNNALVNGIGRIGYMTGGESALWKDEDIAGTLVEQGKKYIAAHQNEPFFLYFATHDIHVPRCPNNRFVGKSGLGRRGDAILQLDWEVGEIVNCLDSLGLRDNTIIIFSSDNGPVLDDGYVDEAKELFADYSVSGPLRGFKGATWEGGTRVSTMISWPEGIEGNHHVSDTRLSHIDLLASFAEMLDVEVPEGASPDGHSMLDQWLGRSHEDRPSLVLQNHRRILSLTEGDWKYIEKAVNVKPNQKFNEYYGSMPEPYLFNIKEDKEEQHNLASRYPEKVAEMAAKLEEIRNRK